MLPELTLCHEKPIYLLHSANFDQCFMTLFMRITTWMFSCKELTCEQLRANAYSIALETPFEILLPDQDDMQYPVHPLASYRRKIKQNLRQIMLM